MKTKQELIIKGLQQRIVELVGEYENKLLSLRVDATMENDKLKAENEDLRTQVDSLNEELQMFRNAEMEVSNEKC